MTQHAPPSRFACLLLAVATLACAAPLCRAEDAPAKENRRKQLRVEKTTDPAGWKVFQGDQLLAGYILDSNGKPILFPIHSANGRAVTRGFPMVKGNEAEREDHDHHRSLWFTHGDVNGVDFWLDDEHCGKIVHREGDAKVTKAGAVVITTHNDWLSPDGERLLSDVRRFTFREFNNRRIIDVDLLLKATDGDVNFGDTKEGSFGMRVAGTMKVDAEPGGKIINAEGKTNKEAWGQKSTWVNYTGPVEGKPLSVTIHDHPSSFNYPCRWHVRTYGLFAANPFGVHHFVGGEQTDGVVLKDGETMRLSYRVVIDDRAIKSKRAEGDSKRYAETRRPELP